VTYTAATVGGTARTFTALSSPGSFTGTGTSPITVSGLTAGTAYTFTVRGNNATGSGEYSAASNSITALAAPASFESIATQTVGAGGTSSITFSSIPSTYKHLQVRGMFRPTSSTWIVGYFNGDGLSTNKYSQHDLRGDGSSASAEATTNANSAYFILGLPTVANTFAVGVTDILDYQNTNKYKTLRSLSGCDANGSGNIDLTSSSWRDTSGISQIELKLNNNGTIPQYSQFALYGIKG
jgi:hypothetical protein